jgi:hypothetical protein
MYVYGGLVCINGGTQKRMVYKGKSQTKIDDLGVPPFMETLYIGFIRPSASWWLSLN